MSGGSFAVQSSAVGIVGEKRMRQRVGRNLLGATQSASPLTPRYDVKGTMSRMFAKFRHKKMGSKLSYE